MNKHIVKQPIRLTINLLIIFLIIILSVDNISSLGITPGRTTLDYTSGEEHEISFSVLNNEHKNMKVLLMIQGELNKSITLFTGDDDGIIEFIPSEESKQFKYTITMPETITNSPGLHTGEILALEIPSGGASGTVVGATTAVTTQLYVYVPCPGKCIDIDLELLDAQKNETATLIVPIINRGKVGIGNARAIIDIYNLDNEKKATLETDNLGVTPGARTELSAKWLVDVNPGNYLAKVTVLYDGETKTFEKQITIGDQILSIESILVNNFQLGEIAKLEILVENKWNTELKSVFANLFVYNDQEQVMADIKSATENIPSLTKKTLIAYWDTVGVEAGEYNGKLMVVHGQKSIDKHLVLDVSEDSLDIFGVGYTIQPKGGRGVDLTTILLFLVIILLVVNLAWFVFFRRLTKKK